MSMVSASNRVLPVYNGLQPAEGRRLPQNISQQEKLLSLGGGALLSLLSFGSGGAKGLLGLGIGASLVYRGVTGHCHLYDMLGVSTAERGPATAVPAQLGTHFETALNVQASPEQLYGYFEDLKRLPDVMEHVKSVNVQPDGRTEWVAVDPFGRELRWETELVNQEANSLIAWKSVPGGDLETAGSIRLKRLPHDRGTAMVVTLKYNPPGGKAGELASWLTGHSFQHQIQEDLRRLKRAVESGEIATTEDQPQGEGA